MRIGIIGTGRIGAFHAETLSGLPAAPVTAHLFGGIFRDGVHIQEVAQ